jgi:cyanate permease
MSVTDMLHNGVSWFEEFTTHATVWAILLPWFISWGARAGIAFPLAFYMDTPREKIWYPWAMGSLSTVIAFLVGWYLWPGKDPIIWALCIGLASPWVYIAAKAVFGWVLPGIKAKIQAKLQKAPEAPSE